MERTTATDEQETTALNWNMLLYVSLFLILVGLLVFSLLRKNVKEQGGQNEPAGPATESVNPGAGEDGEGR